MTAIANGGEPARLHVGRLTASMFDVLGIRPLRGRAFMADDERDDSRAYPTASVAIISYGLWQEWFGGDDDAIGSVVRVDEQPVTIVGIMPRDFAFPTGTHAPGFRYPLAACWAPTAFD